MWGFFGRKLRRLDWYFCRNIRLRSHWFVRTSLVVECGNEVVNYADMIELSLVKVNEKDNEKNKDRKIRSIGAT